MGPEPKYNGWILFSILFCLSMKGNIYRIPVVSRSFVLNFKSI